MAPSSGPLLVPEALRVVKFAISKTKTFIRSKLSSTTTTNNASHQLQPIPLRTTSQPVHPLALLRQSRSQNRWFSSAVRRYASGISRTTQKSKQERSSYPKSTVSAAVTRRGGAPFASTLRPNLTGGVLPRTAGGYSLGGAGLRGVRHFSHTPVAPAQVVNNVSAAVRAFWLSGQKARFDGCDGRGEKMFRCVSQLQDETARKMGVRSEMVKGTSLEFRLSPTITALASFPTSLAESAARSVLPTETLGTDGLLDLLATDFARALKDLAAVLADLKRLAQLGDLPLSLATGDAKATTLQVRFPGCDAQTVERLCDEVGVRRGVIRQDEGFEEERDVEMALLFPFAPSGALSDTSSRDQDVDMYFSPAKQPQPDKLDWRNMLSPSEHTLTSPSKSLGTKTDDGFDAVDHNPWVASSPSGYSSMHDSDYEDNDDVAYDPRAREYDGLEGIYKFLSECDEARR